jgi:Fur family ferric uptake transcriptional regulator
MGRVPTWTEVIHLVGNGGGSVLPGHGRPPRDTSTPHELRRTQQREAVSAALDSVDRFRSARDLHTLICARGSRIGLTTVYRTLQALADAGQVDVLQIGMEALYRRCNPSHHHHLLCRSCGSAVEIVGPAIEAWVDAIAAEHGFDEVAHTLEVFGRCPDCHRQAGRNIATAARAGRVVTTDSPTRRHHEDGLAP